MAPLNTFTRLMRTGIFASDVMVVVLSAIALTLLLSLNDHFLLAQKRGYGENDDVTT